MREFIVELSKGLLVVISVVVGLIVLAVLTFLFNFPYNMITLSLLLSAIYAIYKWFQEEIG